ncbi:MAG: SDR family oxidoreductase [Ilumatobacteraceae bacterium]|jgi:NAD(P)-dependent dehydrogenase (short-subunit alcohol dehydrogenase family)|nr:SDR family oxidoreductase [Ilumatobacteraceae bacterium]
MQDFQDKIAVVTGGGSGMGRELVVQLAAAGCHVAMCDLSDDAMARTKELALADGADVRITTHHCDVSDEDAVLRFRDEVVAQHQTDHVHLMFNNAGIGGGGSMLASSREAWDRTFGVCWFGVYYCTRAFLPLLVAAEEGHLVNTSSVNGFWASIGPDRPHTAYSAAKFAVKGFSEALITDLRVNAPHVKVSVVMPGHIGTSIVENSMKHGAEQLADTDAAMMQVASDFFRDSAPTTAAQAATIILDGVRDERWRILVGDDAQRLDRAVRAEPELAYEGSRFIEILGGQLLPPEDTA